ncbi:MAG TPA: glycosyltransferase family 2 protein [Phototrophicaceae bacterium]|nr:glycosyltransferase family 2 protein [Phototrophicaceae bacterium]
MPDLSIIIINYNTRDFLRACLASIEAQRGDLEVEIIVVDNESKDGSAAMVRGEFPRVRLIEPGVNTWFTGGNNLGVRHAGGAFALLLNADTLIQPGMLPTMVAYLRAHPQVGALTCQQRSMDGNEILRICSRVPRLRDLLLGYTFLSVFWRNRSALWYADWPRNTTRAVEVIPGSCIMARRDLLAHFGPFDERLKLYFPEDDLCRRILADGLEIHFLAEAVLLHEEHASTRQAQRLASRLYFDDLLAFTRKWYGAGGMLILLALVIPTRWGMDIAQRLRGEQDKF